MTNIDMYKPVLILSSKDDWSLQYFEIFIGQPDEKALSRCIYAEHGVMSSFKMLGVTFLK